MLVVVYLIFTVHVFLILIKKAYMERFEIWEKRC